MPSGGSLVRSFLGEAALRLQRLLGLDALVSPKYDTGERIIPVAIVGDGDRPGMAGIRGRRFWIFAQGGAGTGPYITLAAATAVEGIQLDRVVVGAAALTEVQVRLTFGIAAGVTSGNSFVDRAQAIELVPGLSAGSAAAAGTAVGSFNLPANGSLVIPLDVFLTPNQGIQLFHIAATTLSCCFMGRSF